MQARFYAPWYGRFLSPDPARDQHFEETQSWNIYSYVRNNPTMNIDPDGQQSVGAQMRMRAEYEEGFAARAKADTRKFIFFTGAVGLTAATAPAWLPAAVPTLFAASNSPNVVRQITEEVKQAAPAIQQEVQALNTVVAKSGQVFNTIGENAQGIREITSGRLSGFTRLNTDLKGGANAAVDLFKKLTGESPTKDMVRTVLKDGREILYRAASKTGADIPKVEIVDPTKKTLEKITFR